MADTRTHVLPLRQLAGVLSLGRVTLPKQDLAMDLFAFAGTMACAAFFRWEARDVIWALWISSLCVGYATIVASVTRGATSVLGGYRVLAVLAALGSLAFFTVHFGMFHFVHSVFLNGFFPLSESWPGAEEAVGRSDGAPSVFGLVAVTLRLYWPLVAASFLSRLSDIVPPAGSGMKDNIGKAYGNVVRMHLLIFVFAGLHAFGLSRLAIVPVLAAYFFPWGAVARGLRG